MRVALVHDWLNGMRGGERVLEAICEIFPEADIYTLIYERGKLGKIIEKHRIFTSILQKNSFFRSKYRYFLPIFPLLIEAFNLDQYDLIISTSHSVAKGVKNSSKQLHISYIFTPMRYLWDRFDDYFGKGRSSSIVRLMAMLARPFLKKWDINSTKRVDYVLCISNFVQKRIKTYYNIDSNVIYPPVNIKELSIANFKKKNYYLAGGAFVPYKRLDIVINAFNKNGKKLILFGDGPEASSLKRISKKNITYLGRVSDNILPKLYGEAKAFIFPGIEDFGITPLEAQACGTPVIAYYGGGSKETIIDKKTGIFFYKQDAHNLELAIKEFEKSSFSIMEIKNNAKKFNKNIFKNRFKSYVDDTYQKWIKS